MPFEVVTIWLTLGTTATYALTRHRVEHKRALQNHRERMEQLKTKLEESVQSRLTWERAVNWDIDVELRRGL